STLTVNAAAGVLANDLHDADDARSEERRVGKVGWLGGTVVMAADGSYTYDPTSIPTIESLSLGDHVETFSYSIADGHGDVDTGTLSITDHITPEAMMATAHTNAVHEESTLTVNAAAGVLANDLHDADDA